MPHCPAMCHSKSRGQETNVWHCIKKRAVNQNEGFSKPMFIKTFFSSLVWRIHHYIELTFTFVPDL
jgi:hypothetical protein